MCPDLSKVLKGFLGKDCRPAGMHVINLVSLGPNDSSSKPVIPQNGNLNTQMTKISTADKSICNYMKVTEKLKEKIPCTL